VNARGLEPGAVRPMRVRKFDGQHWERHMESRLLEGSL
jgi:hypothetical protein